jgi:hypothetical protein
MFSIQFNTPQLLNKLIFLVNCKTSQIFRAKIFISNEYSLEYKTKKKGIEGIFPIKVNDSKN